MALVKFLLIFLAVFYALRLIGRWVIGSWIRRVQNAYGTPQTRGASREKRMREGEVKVSGRPADSRKINDNIGDYVDYEEIP